jgi:hypothetical protein
VLRKHDIAIADGRVGNSGEVEGRFGVGKVTAPEIEECPEGDFPRGVAGAATRRPAGGSS